MKHELEIRRTVNGEIELLKAAVSFEFLGYEISLTNVLEPVSAAVFSLPDRYGNQEILFSAKGRPDALIIECMKWVFARNEVKKHVHQ